MKNNKYFLTIEGMLAIGNRIAEARISKGYKSKSVAEQVGVSSQYYSRIESGVNLCSVETLLAISIVLDISLDYIIFGNTKSNDLKHIESLLADKDDTTIKKILAMLKALLDDNSEKANQKMLCTD